MGGGFGDFVRAVGRPMLVRTCKVCGYTWTLPRYFAKTRPKGMTGSIGGSTDGYSHPTSVAGVDAMVDRNASMAGQVAVYRTCAKCGSQDYTQKRIWRETTADFEGPD
jgi:predicted nucleic-acid-binding Zn-ribbon protein